MEDFYTRPTDVRIGQMIGDYQVLSILGRGAFAHVYLVKHRYLKILFAVKIMRRIATSVQKDHFLQEAQIAAQFNHPQIIRVVHFAVEDDIPYLVMDYAEHGSLREHHPFGERLPRELLLDYAWQIADALDYVQLRQYIHQDVKPENLLFGQDGQILLSDFGIAIAVQDVWKLRNQECIGTLAYMSPEQIERRPCLVSDVYSLGVILYEWICGDVPFDGAIQDVARQHLYVLPPSLCARVSGLPQEVEWVIMKALAKDPRARFTSAGKCVAALEEAWQKSPPVQRPIEFYAKTTYQQETPNETPAIQLPAPLPQGSQKQMARQQPGCKSSNQLVKTQRSGRNWPRIVGVFFVDLLLGLVLWSSPLIQASPLAGLLWIAVLVSLPVGIGLGKKDNHILHFLAGNLVFALASGLIFQSVSVFMDVFLVGAIFISLLALSFSVHRC